MIRKYTRLLLARDSAQLCTDSGFEKQASLASFNFVPEPGMLYVATRAISSRVNANYDGWPPSELRNAYKTFIGKGIFVDHNNWDPERARGVILDANLHDGKLASGHEDVWVELLLEVDAHAFPKLAQAVLSGDIDAVSMGADVEYTICSVCDNKAHDTMQYCAHIPGMKGKMVAPILRTKQAGIPKLCYEDCFGVSFFEISLVFDPADESALIRDTFLASGQRTARTQDRIRRPSESIPDYTRRIQKSASFISESLFEPLRLTELRVADKQIMALPDDVDTLRDELMCPQCFTPETLVRAEEGYIPIGTIEVGDKVLTESGEFHKVLNVYRHEFSGLLHEIETSSTIRPVRVTSEHPFKAMVGYHRMVVDGKEEASRRLDCLPSGPCKHNLRRTDPRTHHHLEWVKAEDLEKTYVKLGMPSEVKDIELVEVPKLHYRNYPSRMPSTLPVDSEFLWIVGIYIAEGSAGKRSLSFGLHVKEVNFQQRIIDYFAKFGINSHVYPRGKNGVAVEVYNAVFARWFPEWLGSGSANKQIPQELMQLPVDKMRVLLQGIFDGDGTKSRNTIGQTSANLALQMAELSLVNNGLPTITTQYPVDKKPVFSVNGIAVDVLPRTHTTKRGIWKFQGETLGRVIRNDLVPYIGPVFNLEVENDPTYVVQNIVVHNCGAEWDGIICENCGFEMPPPGLDDPNVDAAGVQMPFGGPGAEEEGAPPGQEEETEEAGQPGQPVQPGAEEGQEPTDEEAPDEESSDEDEDNKKKPPKSKSDKSKSKDKNSKPNKGDKDKKTGGKRVSRYDELLRDGSEKMAKLPVDPPYRQDTAPAQSVAPYGQSFPNGIPVPAPEPAIEPAPPQATQLQDLDAEDLVAPVGQSAVTVVAPPEPRPNGPEVSDSSKAASKDERRAEFFKARADQLERQAANLRKKAEEVFRTDVRNLDEPAPVNVGPDAVVDVMTPTDNTQQLERADTPDVINDGTETGVPAVAERVPQQTNPFNDAALAPYGQPANIPFGVSETLTGRSASAEDVEKQKAVEAARDEQRINAAKTRVLRIANFVDERIDLGMSVPDEKLAEIARFEDMDDATLDGYVQATREFRANRVRTAGQRIRVSASSDVPQRLERVPANTPSFASAPAFGGEVEIDDGAEDYLAFLKG